MPVAFQYDNANRKTQSTLPDGVALTYSGAWPERIRRNGDGRVVLKTGSMAASEVRAAVTRSAFNWDNWIIRVQPEGHDRFGFWA